jgi:hypothetical protein
MTRPARCGRALCSRKRGVLAAIAGRARQVGASFTRFYPSRRVAHHGPETRDPTRGNDALAARGPLPRRPLQASSDVKLTPQKGHDHQRLVTVRPAKALAEHAFLDEALAPIECSGSLVARLHVEPEPVRL